MKNRIIVIALAVACTGLLCFLIYLIRNPRIGDSTVNQSPFDGSVEQVEEYIKAHANDAGSYEPVEWDTLYTVSGIDAKYKVKHKFRAANKFGAKVLMTAVFYLDSTGQVIAVDESEE